MADSNASNINISRSLQDIWVLAANNRFLNKRGILAQYISRGVKSVLASPVNTLITVSTVGVILFILGLFFLVIQNLGEGAAASRDQLTVSIYLEKEITDVELENLWEEIKKDQFVENIEFWSKSRALIEFKKSLGGGDSLSEGLEIDNPLPASLEVSFKEGSLTETSYNRFVNKFTEYPGILSLQHNSGLLGQLGELIYAIRAIGYSFSFILCIVSAFVISSTIRLALVSRANDLAIMRLVGAGKWAIRLPCFLEGFLQGVLGSFFALFLVYFVYDFMHPIVNQSILRDFLGFDLKFIGIAYTFLLIGLGPVLGVLGSYLAVRDISEI